MVARIALTFSLLICCLGSALAGPYGDLNSKLEAAKTDAQRKQILTSSPLVTNDSKLMAVLNRDSNEDDDSMPSGSAAVAEAIETLALAERSTPHHGLQAMATEIKRSPIYADPGERDQTNWLGKALERLRNLRFHFPQPKTKGPDLGFLGEWFIYFAWFVLGVAVLCFLLFIVKRADLSALFANFKKKQVLDEEEPDRTLDEWLALADRLESEGKYREAVRSLYLACLLKIDEAKIARFDRGQTNWEHLARIEASPRKPEGFDFRGPTQAFDLIWYGYRVDGPRDVARFRNWYQGIIDATRQGAGQVAA